jgi:hypothetical protein
VFDLSNLEAPLKWDDNYGARIGIMPRMGTNADIRWFDVDPCYVFHPLNAYVEGDSVVCDVGRHASMWRTSMEDGEPCYLHRWTFDLASGAVSEQQLDGDSHAFPRVDDRVVGLGTATAGASPRVAAGTGRSSSPATWSSGTSDRRAADLRLRPEQLPGRVRVRAGRRCRRRGRGLGDRASCTTPPRTAPTW